MGGCKRVRDEHRSVQKSKLQILCRILGKLGHQLNLVQFDLYNYSINFEHDLLHCQF